MSMREKIARTIREAQARPHTDAEVADAVLDALMEPTDEMIEAGYGWHYRLDTTLGRERAVADAASFIRAAQEGK